jgi:hypothetical protein
MSRVREVHDRLAPLLRDRARLNLASRPGNTLRSWVYFAQSYCAAASALEDSLDTHIHPRIQLYGHAIECALKAFLVSKKHVIPQGSGGHDLVNLAAIAESQGCHITELQAMALVQVSSLFSIDIGTRTRYEARYPSKNSESRESTVGDFENIHELVTSVCSQSDA